jgi:hypothetical protein
MSSTALVISVEPVPATVHAGALRPSSIRERLFGAAAEPNHAATGPVELDLHGFTKPLLVDFGDYLRQRIAHPWKATGWFLESYLFGVEHKAVVRRHRESVAAGWHWTLELTFDDCAGMAGVSAQLAAHWAERWYTVRRAVIEESVLRPGGLEPLPGSVHVEAMNLLFLPAGGLGYAARARRSNPVNGASGSSYGLVLDTIYDAATDGGTEAALQYLLENVLPLTADGRCRCQLCMPELDGDGLTCPTAVAQAVS